MTEMKGPSYNFAKGNAADVLIVGAGPAGLMAATTLARYGVSFRIIDKRPQRVLLGHASGTLRGPIHDLSPIHHYVSCRYSATDGKDFSHAWLAACYGQQ